MYPSNSNCNQNPISFPGQVFQHRPLSNRETNLNSKWEDPPSASLFYFPSPCTQYEDAFNELTWQQLHDLFLQQQPLTDETVSNTADLNKDAVNELKEDWSKKFACTNEQFPKRRSSKKDRHSKINTAHGPRDRRMRLSLDVARRFFDLQDMLGFDKASRTVEWLLLQSSSAIDEIMRDQPRMTHTCSIGFANSISSASECEVVSGIDESNTNENQHTSISIKVKIKSSCNKEKKVKLPRRSAFHRLPRESRKIARERARKRTIEKRRLGESMLCLEAKDHDSNRLGSWSHFERGEESGTQGPKINPSYERLTEVEELSSHDRQFLNPREYAGGDSLIITGNWNASAFCNYQQNAEISDEQNSRSFSFLANHGKLATSEVLVDNSFEDELR